MGTQTDNEARVEFDRQVENLLAKGYPALAGLDEDAFRDRLLPLEERLSEVVPGGLFAVVVDVPRHEAIARVELEGRRGFTTMEAADLERFAPLDGAAPPAAPYLVTDVDTGAATLSVTPDDALETILGESRSPLTIDEGLAVVAHHAEVLRTRNCFSMLASRCGDRRVTAMWVSGGRPRLGWCWAGNPHTWLGSASCAGRIGSRPSELAA